MKLKLALILTVLLVSCGESNSISEKKVAGRIDNINIYTEDLDDLVKYDVYDALKRIELLRKSAFEQIVRESIFNTTSQKLGMTYEEFIEKSVLDNVNDSSVQMFIRINNLMITGIRDVKNGYKILYPNTPEGLILAREEYINFLTNSLYDSLKQGFKIEYQLKSVKIPRIKIDDVPVVYYSGKSDAATSVVLIANFDCENCIAFFPLFDSLYTKYQDKVKFGYIPYSKSIASLYSQIANKKGLAWEFVKASYSLSGQNDSTKLVKLIKKIGISDSLIDHYSGDKQLLEGLSQNEEVLRRKRIFTTPTLLINGELVLDLYDFRKLENLITKSLTD